VNDKKMWEQPNNPLCGTLLENVGQKYNTVLRRLQQMSPTHYIVIVLCVKQLPSNREVVGREWFMQYRKAIYCHLHQRWRNRGKTSTETKGFYTTHTV